jgi:hypothetical protein
MGACNMAADAQGTEGGERGQRSFNLAGFDAVSLAGPHDVVVTVGSGHSVRAEGDRTALDRLEIEVDGGNLKIGTKKGNWPMDWSKGRAKTTIYVSLPAIRAAAIAGSGDMRVDRVRADRFAGSIAGSGDLQIASMQVTDAKFSVAGLRQHQRRRSRAAIDDIDRRLGRGEPGRGGEPVRRDIGDGIGRRHSARRRNGQRFDHGLGRRDDRGLAALHRQQAGLGQRPLRRLRDFG